MPPRPYDIFLHCTKHVENRECWPDNLVGVTWCAGLLMV